jgi:hypothetical protein
MGISLGLTSITNALLGSSQASSIRLGSTLAWQYSSIDPDAEAFLIATGITDPTITSAINTFVIQIKSDGIWDKCNPIYPFVGGTATTHKFNLKDPRDLDAAYRLTYFGGLTHDSNGVKPNGTTGWIRTHWNPFTLCSSPNYDTHMVSFIRDLINTTSYDFGNIGPGGAGGLNTSYNHLYVASEGVRSGVNQLVESRYTYANFPIGMHLVVRANQNPNLFYRNGVFVLPNLTEGSPAEPYSEPVAIFGVARAGSAIALTARGSSFVTIGNQSLNATEASNYYTAVQNLQTALGRNV